MLDAYRDLLDGLTHESTTLRELLGTPVPDDLPESVFAELRAIRGRESAMLRRAQSIMRGGNIMLRDISREPEVVNAADATESPDDVLAAFTSDRGELVSLLMNLTIKDWEREVNHATLGETTMSDEIDEHLQWEDEALQRVRDALGTSG